jgi:hypothetical protein
MDPDRLRLSAWSARNRVCTTLARALSRSVCACAIACTRIVESSRATTWPRRTWALKSAPSSAIWPDTCVPTATVRTALSVPVALTVDVMSPRSTATKRYDADAGERLRAKRNPAVAIAATAMIGRTIRTFFIGAFLGLDREPQWPASHLLRKARGMPNRKSLLRNALTLADPVQTAGPALAKARNPHPAAPRSSGG